MQTKEFDRVEKQLKKKEDELESLRERKEFFESQYKQCRAENNEMIENKIQLFEEIKNLRIENARLKVKG